jgi:hypothetical protein
MRESTERAEKERIDEIVNAGFLVEAESVTADSVVVVSQKHTSAAGEVREIAKYRVLDLGSEMFKDLAEKFKDAKKAGVVIDTLENGESLVSTIEAIYSPSSVSYNEGDKEAAV